MDKRASSHQVAIGETGSHDAAEFVSGIASACGFDFVPPVLARRGRGGDWSPKLRVIRIGMREWEASGDRLWYLIAHELAHAQAKGNEGHSRAFWKRLTEGLKTAGRIELIRLDFGYREGALWAARESGLDNVPVRSEFLFGIGHGVVDRQGRRWVVKRRFRRGGRPHYRLVSPGWTWRVPEDQLLLEAR